MNHFRKISILGLILVLLGALILATLPPIKANASINDANGLIVGATYYGGNYDDGLHSWVIDNANQCNRINAGEFTAQSLGAVKSPHCSDDNGLGYLNDIPLHNTVSYAELSINPAASDYSALGGLAAGTKLEIKYQGRCVIAEKRDVGQGGGPVNGYQRSIDLWWQTARALGFTNGFDNVQVRLVSSSTSLTPLGSTSTCGSSSSGSSTTTPKSSNASGTTNSTTGNGSSSSSATAGSTKPPAASPPAANSSQTSGVASSTAMEAIQGSSDETGRILMSASASTSPRFYSLVSVLGSISICLGLALLTLIVLRHRVPKKRYKRQLVHF